MHWSGYGMGWGMGFGWIFMIIFWAAIIFLVFYLVRTLTTGHDREHCHTGPVDILKERYARGEIGREDFEKMKDELRKG